MTTTGGDSRASRLRGVAARALAWLFAGVAAVPMFGLIDLGTLFGLSDARYEWAMSLEVSWGSLLTFFVAAGYGWVGAAPSRPWPGLGLLGLAAAGLVLAGAAFADPAPAWLALGIAVATLLLCVLVRPGRPSREPGPPRLAAAAVAAVGVVVWLGYAANTLLAGRDAESDWGDVTMGVDHWPVQVALGLALAAGCALLAIVASPLLLWRWAFGLSAAFVAYATLVFPERAGAMPHPGWGAAIAAWGVAVVLVPRRRLSP